ncbi:MAG TPA: hypothetical protein VES67_21820 [Vicinamibacterales bacterium]|nr:hypothetical protein [Vicinamibacterales bacterium]
MDPTTLFARQPLPGVKVSETPPTPPAPAPPAAQPPAAAISYQGQPPWVTAELPPQYGELANKIAAIQAEARKYEDIAGVVWQSDKPLIVAVRNLFAAMQFEAEVKEGASYDVSVQVESGRRLLVVVVASREGIPRKSPQIGQIVRTLQEDAGPHDRVVLAANAFCETPASSRQDPVAPDALRIIQGLGANFVATPTLLGLWKYSLTDLASAKKSVLRLHAQDGGIFR